jgi:hypothetical protein
MADEVALLPCPFCGNSVLSWTAIRDDVAVVCDCCGTRGPRKGDLSVARNAWNCRPTDPALAAKDALHEAVVVALDHLTAGLGKREDVILELREAHLRAADVDHANRSLSPKEIRIKELEAALAAAQAEVKHLRQELADIKTSRGSCGWCVYGHDWRSKWSAFGALEQRGTCLHPDHAGLEVLGDLSCDLFKRKEES